MMDSSNRTAVEAGAVKQSKKRFRSAEEKRRIVAATLSMLLEGIDWRRPERTAVPQMAS
jgi:hypothetical protein